jgi:ferredoxin-NADP reductase
MLKHALLNYPKLDHTFIYSNKTWDDVIFREELAELESTYPNKLKLVHTLTREPNPALHGPNVRAGRVSTTLLKEFIPDPTGSMVYVCGPAISVHDREIAKENGTEPQPRFLESVLTGLKEVGVPNERIKRESYG